VIDRCLRSRHEHAAADRAELAVSVVFGGTGGAGFHGSLGPIRGTESPQPFGKHRNDSENRVILAEWLRNTTSESRLNAFERRTDLPSKWFIELFVADIRDWSAAVRSLSTEPMGG
jgi:hypothetical protein